MTTTATNIPASDEQEALERVAYHYQAKDYRVVTAPVDDDLPPFLSSFRPDLLAIGLTESVVVAVKKHAELADPDLLALARTVHAQSGWRLEVIVPDEVRSRWDAEPAYPIAADVVDGFLTLADEALRRGQTEAATVLGWTAAEAALRLLAQKRGVVLEDLSPSLLVRQLFSEGWLDRKQYQALLHILEQRNHIVHGLRPSPDSKAETNQAEILAISRDVLSRAMRKERK